MYSLVKLDKIAEKLQMGKKNLKPQQQQPVMRFTVAKPLEELSEENLTEGWSSDNFEGAMASWQTRYVGRYCLRGCSFDGDDE